MQKHKRKKNEYDERFNQETYEEKERKTERK